MFQLRVLELQKVILSASSFSSNPYFQQIQSYIVVKSHNSLKPKSASNFAEKFINQKLCSQQAVRLFLISNNDLSVAGIMSPLFEMMQAAINCWNCLNWDFNCVGWLVKVGLLCIKHAESQSVIFRSAFWLGWANCSILRYSFPFWRKSLEPKTPNEFHNQSCKSYSTLRETFVKSRVVANSYLKLWLVCVYHVGSNPCNLTTRINDHVKSHDHQKDEDEHFQGLAYP